MTELSPIPLEDLHQRFERDGYVFPYQAMPADEALAYRAEVETLMAERPDAIEYARGHANLVFPAIDRLSRDERIIDAASAILGSDVLLWGAGLVPKPPQSDRFISWHQDLTYWGLDGTDEVAVWMSLGEVTPENGCMRFLPGSHCDGIKPHRDTFNAANSLSRGQVVDAVVDESQAVDVVLGPGQLSLHDGRLFHASGPNKTDRWRVGLVIQYIAPSMKQVVAKEDYAQLVRGADVHKHFKMLPRPRVNYDSACLEAREKVMTVRNDAYFQGAEQRPVGASVFVNRA